MESDVVRNNESCRHIGLVSNEVAGIQKTLEQIDADESQITSLLDTLLRRKKNLTDSAQRLETMVKNAAEAAVEEARHIQELDERFETEAKNRERQIGEMETAIHVREGRIVELEQALASARDEIDKRTADRDNFLKIRETVLKELKSTRDSMSLLVTGLSALDDAQVVNLDEGQEDRSEETRKEIREIEERMSSEIKKLKASLRDKELAIAAKNVEIQMLTESMGAKIEELEERLDTKKNNKSAKLVSFLTEIRSKRPA